MINTVCIVVLNWNILEKCFHRGCLWMLNYDKCIHWCKHDTVVNYGQNKDMVNY